MHKLLISIIFGASLFISGCSSLNEFAESVPEYASNLPIMYRPTIQQGNVITQEMINNLKPGMSKRQVTYTLGTPGLVDSFHQNRWDYVYSIKKNTEKREQKNLTLYFEDDRLFRIEGDYRPLPVDEMAVADKKENVVDVPDYEPEKKGLVTKTLEAVGIKPKEE
jgi:outer membrane protein assembly factor BamE